MLADNRGESGILAFLALLTGPSSTLSKKYFGFFILLGILGVAILYCDSVILRPLPFLELLKD